MRSTRRMFCVLMYDASPRAGNRVGIILSSNSPDTSPVSLSKGMLSTSDVNGASKKFEYKVRYKSFVSLRSSPSIVCSICATKLIRFRLSLPVFFSFLVSFVSFLLLNKYRVTFFIVDTFLSFFFVASTGFSITWLESPSSSSSSASKLLASMVANCSL